MNTAIRRALCLGLLAMACATPAWAAVKTQAELVLAVATVKPGETVEAGVLLRMPAGIHTYWQNPGDSGLATTIAWELPPGVRAGAIQWPVPSMHEDSGLVTFIFEGTVLLRVPLTVSADCAPGRLPLKAKVAWLECSTGCIPGDAVVEGMLEVGARTAPSAHEALFAAWRARSPQPAEPAGLKVSWIGPGGGEARELELSWRGQGAEALFLPLVSEAYEVSTEAGRQASAAAGMASLRKQVKRAENAPWPREIPGVLVERTHPEVLAYAVVLRPGGEGERAGAGAEGTGVEAGVVGGGGAPSRSVGVMLLFAFLGGLILNVMPCVLPVIALKVLSFVRQAKEEPAAVRRHGLLYGAGVLVSFACLAGVVVMVQQAGRLASWGMHFQSPGFLLVMTTLVFLVALNLFGVFEVTLGGGAMSAAAGLASKEGGAGAFFNGVLATTLATPCTAPYLGTAVGWAFAQPPVVILLLFLVIGAGLAAPFVAICFLPALAKFLPKPGLWMERFKVAMGFPMLGAGAWLLSLVARHYGNGGVLWVGLFLVCVAAAAWVWGQFVQRPGARRGLAVAASLALVAGGYAVGLEHQLQWRTASAPSSVQGGISKEGGIAWERWTPEALAQAREAGRPVLVDFTADWCVTCQANKKTSIEIPAVAAKLGALGARALLGDYTLRDDVITRELQKFGRGGVPLVLVYPADAGKPPLVLPELLTPSLMLEALEKASAR